MDPAPAYDDASSVTGKVRRVPIHWPKVWNRPPKSRHRSLWKPFALRAPTLIFVILLSAGLIIVLQLLLMYSRKYGGILFDSDINTLPFIKSFRYLYLPTLITVAYSLLWGWIELSAKRLEPFYQLSQTDGTSASNSLLLKYSFDFIPFIPFQAIRRRHWSTFSASTGMLLIFWALTPMQAAIFTTDKVTRTFPTTMLRSTSYLPANEQNTTSVGAVYDRSLFNIAWLNASLPPFMTRNFALAPFGPENDDHTVETSEFWTGTTSLFSVNITCEQPIRKEKLRSDYYVSKDIRATEYSFWSSNGCNNSLYDFTVRLESLYTAYYFNQYSLSYSYIYPQKLSCPIKTSNTFAIAWVRNLGSESNRTGATYLFCNATYYRQEVSATVSLPHKSVIHIRPLGPPSPVPSDMFNLSAFEEGLAFDGWTKSKNVGYSLQFSDHKNRLKDMNLDTHISNLPPLAPFAIAAYQQPSQNYLDPRLLQDSYQAAYRLLFAQRMTKILTARLNRTRPVLGERHFTTQAIVVVPSFVYIVESILAFMILFAATLLCSYNTRPLKLISNPTSLTSAMSLVADNSSVLNDFKELDKAAFQEVERALSGKRYWLALQEDNEGKCQPRLEGTSGGIAHQVDPSFSTYYGVRPKGFRMWIGVPFIIFQIICLILLVIIHVKSVRPQGLPLPSSNRFARQLVENYLPIIIATFMEPIWVLFIRYLCILQPFEELRRGRAVARKSISADYSSLPPQFTFWKAFSSGHIILGTVCCIALLANILAVALSGLFYEAVVHITHAANFSSSISTPFNGDLLYDSYNNTASLWNDHIYIAMSNLSSGTPMPPFTDDKFFYVPFNSTSTWPRRATTRALGAKLDCVPLLSAGPNSVNTVSWETGKPTVPFEGNANISVTIAGDDTKPPCAATEVVFFNPTEEAGMRLGRVASEMVGSFCGEYLVVGWMRGNASEVHIQSDPLRPPLFHHSNITVGSTESTILACHSRIITGISDVTVDGEGKVQQAYLLNEFERSPKSWFADAKVPESVLPRNSSFFAQILLLDVPSSGRAIWHTDLYIYSLYNSLISTAMNSSRFFDPSLPAPSAEELAPQLSATYSKIFAILLGSNVPLILPNATHNFIPGSVIKPTTRLFVSRPMAILSEVILCLNIIVTILIYIRRPGRYLPRLPTSLASVTGFFAASRAVVPLKGTSGLSTKERDRHVEELQYKYGYGHFVGTDGKTKIGIESQPFLVPLKEEDLKVMRDKSSKDRRSQRNIRTNT